MKSKVLEFIENNYKNLSEAEIELLANQMCAVLPKKARKLCEIKAGSKFKYKGYEFTKLADEENSCYCLLNESVFVSKFGETNDWAKSPIRKRLNAFDEEGNCKAIKGIKKSDLVAVSLNYTAYKIPNGRTEERITLPSWEEYMAYEYMPINEFPWLRSGNYSDPHTAYVLDSDGSVTWHWVGNSYAVRPALHLKSDIKVEIGK